MPTFREDVHLGTKVPLMKTDDYNDQSVTEEKIKDTNITTKKISDAAITTPKIADQNVTTAKIADGNVTTVKIADQNVTTGKIKDGAVVTDKIADKNIINAKLGDSSVDTRTLKDSSVTTSKLYDGSVIEAKLADNSVSTSKIQSGAVTEEKIHPNYVKKINDATDAANKATNAANEATSELEAKKQEVNEAVSESKAQTEAAKDATEKTLESKAQIESKESERQDAEETRNASENTRIEAEKARDNSENERNVSEERRTIAENSRGEAENARVEAEKARVKAENSRVNAEIDRENSFSSSKKASDDATEKALSTYNHPPYVDADGYYYKWDVITQSYNKTNVNLTGKAFQIKKVFPSVSEMVNTDVNTFKENDFVLINTANTEDEDNAKVYVVAVDEKGKKFYSYLVDMSGFRGFTGKTPQMLIGTVTTLPEDANATSTLSSDGVDSNGNPKYKLNLGIPKGIRLRFSDLTENDKAELMKPATDAASEANSQTKLCKEATDNAVKATSESVEQTNIAEEQNNHPMKIGENGNWWKWNLKTKTYEDTLIIARGGAMYPTFRQRRNKLLIEDYGSNISDRVIRKRNKLILKV